MYRRLTEIFLISLILFAPPLRAQQQAPDFSGKTIRILVQFPAGGVPDNLARAIAIRLGEGLKANVIIDNRPGAIGAIAANVVKSAAPDGLTLLMADSSTYSIAPFIKQLNYDPLKDFAPVSITAQSLVVLITNPSAAGSLKEFIDLAKSKPGLPYASSGVGSVHHLAMEMLKSVAGIDLLHVPYKGSSESVPSVVAGDTVAAFAGLNTAKAFEKSGKVKILATVTAQRTKLAPEIPTFAEAGVPGVSMSVSFGLFAPLKTPPAILAKLSEEITKIAASPGFAEQIGLVGLEPASSTPKQLQVLVEKERDVFRAVIKAGNIKDN